MPGPNGTIAHAEVKIDDSIVILADAGERFQPAEKNGQQVRSGVWIDTYACCPTFGGISSEFQSEFRMPRYKMYDVLSGITTRSGHLLNR